MCTAIALNAGKFCFGRNMDLDYDFGEHIVITPRKYPFRFRKTAELKEHYAIIGMAAVAENYPLYADAANEYGLCMAGLNFPDYAYYQRKAREGKTGIAPFELIAWVLGRCKTVKEAECLLEATEIIDIPFSKELPLTALHWIISDKSGSLTVEAVREGLRLYRNPVNVLTNSPPFEFQLLNLCHYYNLSVKPVKNRLSAAAGIKSFGKGLGSFGLPGDSSPASRFVRAAYLSVNSCCENTDESCISQTFHLLDSAAVVRGSIETEGKCPYYTTYSSCILAERGVYCYKTYNNSRISAVDMKREALGSAELIEYPLERSQQILWQN